MKKLPHSMSIPFEVYLLNGGCRSNLVKHQGIAQFWKKGTKVMEINNFGEMNKPMQQAYAQFLQQYLKHGRRFLEVLREQVK